MKTHQIPIYVLSRISGRPIEVATYSPAGRFFVLQRRGQNGIYSETEKQPAANLKEAVKGVQRVYFSDLVTA